MIEVSGIDLIENYWQFTAICILTNGQIRNDGQAVMGAGIAKSARDRWPELGARLGGELKRCGNVPVFLGSADLLGGKYNPNGGPGITTAIWSFPTKHHWKDRSDPKLIENSARLLVQDLRVSGSIPNARIGLPRPGCGLGGLKWEEVKPILTRYLDDRFVIVSFDAPKQAILPPTITDTPVEAK